jgi:16S rRNA C1402 N4-methylase RsmH
MVKDFGRNLTRDYDVIGEVDVPELRKERAARARWIVKRTQPSDVELAENPRARSAQLRAIEKLGETPSGTGEAPVLPKK